MSNRSAFKAEEIRTLRDQITSNLERAWEITGRSEDELTGVMVQILAEIAVDDLLRGEERSEGTGAYPESQIWRIYSGGVHGPTNWKY